jgi:Fe-S-cluster-containing hydrogenase component 2
MRKYGMFSRDKSRVSILRLDEEGLYMPVVCEHCVDAPCASVCPVKAINRNVEIGAVTINIDRCVGCGKCQLVCPFGLEIIKLEKVDGKTKAFKCDLCGGDPACVKVCVLGALKYMDFSKSTVKKKREFAEKRAGIITSLKVKEVV